MNVVAVIQTRMGSTRFPGKVMVKLNEKHKVLDYVINQLRFCKSIKNLIIATSYLEQDDVIVKYAKENDLEYIKLGRVCEIYDDYTKYTKTKINNENRLNKERVYMYL